MAIRRIKEYPKMTMHYNGPQGVDVGSNKNGDTYYAYYCERDGEEVFVAKNAPGIEGPFFGGKKKCGCTSVKELTEYFDPCQNPECAGDGKIYLTPGAAMARKMNSGYTPRKYCNACLNSIVFRGICRNKACQSVGGDGNLEATFGEKLNYEEKKYTFPPNNCQICRRVKKHFKEKGEVRPNCSLCRKSFRVSGEQMKMILKNETSFAIPKECPRCRNLAPDDRRKVEANNELGKEKKKLIAEAMRLLKGDKKLLAKERKNHIEEKKISKEKKMELILLKSQGKKSVERFVAEKTSGFDKTGVITDAQVAHYLAKVPLAAKLMKSMNVKSLEYTGKAKGIIGPVISNTLKDSNGRMIKINHSSNHNTSREVMQTIFVEMGKDYYYQKLSMSGQQNWALKMNEADLEKTSGKDKPSPFDNSGDSFAKCFAIYCQADIDKNVEGNNATMEKFADDFPDQKHMLDEMLNY